jgi:hypothetical protein
MAIEIQVRTPRRANRSRVQSPKALQARRPNFTSFDRSFYMYIRTTDGIVLWNRSRSMLHNGFRPSEVALKLYQDFGVRIGAPSPEADPARDCDVINYFSRLVIPDDAVTVPSIFDDGGRA